MEDGFFGGKLLIAMPGIGDPRFERALILVCTHDARHAMGVAVNQPVEGLTVSELLHRLEIAEEVETPSDAVLLGGPVERERGFVLHTSDYSAEHSLDVGGGILLTPTRDVLEAMAGERSRRPRRALLALGYAGWGEGQLENEIKQNVWLACDADESLIFDSDHEQKWGRALAKLGVDARNLSAVAGRA